MILTEDQLELEVLSSRQQQRLAAAGCDGGVCHDFRVFAKEPRGSHFLPLIG